MINIYVLVFFVVLNWLCKEDDEVFLIFGDSFMSDKNGSLFLLCFLCSIIEKYNYSYSCFLG